MFAPHLQDIQEQRGWVFQSQCGLACSARSRSQLGQRGGNFRSCGMSPPPGMSEARRACARIQAFRFATMRSRRIHITVVSFPRVKPRLCGVSRRSLSQS